VGAELHDTAVARHRVSYTVNPLVNWLELMKVPRVAGTVIVMASIIGALIFGTYSLRGQMHTIVAQLPEAAATFATGLAGDRDARRDVHDHLDDGTNRPLEFSGRVHIAVVLGLAVGRLGNAAQHSHHRHR
jgi:predicted PurR-regulated permease PerM